MKKKNNSKKYHNVDMTYEEIAIKEAEGDKYFIDMKIEGKNKSSVETVVALLVAVGQESEAILSAILKNPSKK